jgi:hypothetical protein
MWRSAAHHTPTVTLVPPEPTTASPSRALYAHQVIQQVAYSQGGGGASGSAMDRRVGHRVGAEGVLWGATSGFVQGEWDRKYSTIDCCMTLLALNVPERREGMSCLFVFFVIHFSAPYVQNFT